MPDAPESFAFDDDLVAGYSDTQDAANNLTEDDPFDDAVMDDFEDIDETANEQVIFETADGATPTAQNELQATTIENVPASSTVPEALAPTAGDISPDSASTTGEANNEPVPTTEPTSDVQSAEPLPETDHPDDSEISAQALEITSAVESEDSVPSHEDDLSPDTHDDFFEQETTLLGVQPVTSSEEVAWTFSLLSMPNAAQYPSLLSREAQHALVVAHVTPLHVPSAIKKEPRAKKDVKKLQESVAIPVTVPEEAISSPQPNSATAQGEKTAATGKLTTADFF